MGKEQIETGAPSQEVEKRPSIRVAVCATPWLSVPPEKYGGTEALIYDGLINYPGQNIDYFLYTIGETTRLPTAKRLTGEIGYYFDQDLYGKIKDPNALEKEAIHTMHFYKVLEERIKNGEDFDLIHQHQMFVGGLLAFGHRINRPHLITIHGPIEDESTREFLSAFEGEPGIYFAAISDNQKRHFPELPWIRTVYNGINTESFPFQEEKMDFLLSIGRISPAKGQAHALKVAKDLGKTLVLAGNIEDQNYFDTQIASFITGRADQVGSGFPPLEFTQMMLDRRQKPDIIYFGEANFEEKTWLYQNAKALLNPIDWEEPFGLVMVESMACGTPVVSHARGAAPEIILNGKTGFLVEGTNEMTEVVDRLYKGQYTISPQDCRQHVEENFSAQTVARNYRQAYDDVIERERQRKLT